MIQREVHPRPAFAELSQRSLHGTTGAVLTLLRTAARPATQRSHRWVALLLLGSIVLLGAGALVGTRLASPIALPLCLVGALGLLVSGFAGTQLEPSSPSPQRPADELPSQRGPR